MSSAKINSALVTVFVNAALFTKAVTQQENTEFVPPSSGPWCALWFMPNQPSVATLGPAGSDAHDGIFQIDLNYPPQTGRGAAQAMAETIKALYKAGYMFTYQGETAVVRSCGYSPGKLVGGAYKISVTVYYYARINR